MGSKLALRSYSSKIIETTNPMINRPLLGGDENPLVEEHWVIPYFLGDNLFDESFDWESLPYSKDPTYIACGEPDDLLIIDLDLKHIPWLGTYRGDFDPSTNVVFKSHTSISKGKRSWCRRVLTNPFYVKILQKVQLMDIILVFSWLDISKDTEGLLSLLYRWNSTTHTFFMGCQEVSPSLEDVYEILRLPLFGEGDVTNIPLTSKEAKTMKFLKDAVKKNLKKPI